MLVLAALMRVRRWGATRRRAGRGAETQLFLTALGLVDIVDVVLFTEEEEEEVVIEEVDKDLDIVLDVVILSVEVE